MSDVKLSRIDAVFADLEYPITQDHAVTELEDVTLLLADGERNLGTLVEKSERDRFESMDDLRAELHNVLPREAVGEPYQSEGEG
ncbi:DUF5789 family protein [Natrinema ejinorense]|uniref:DUF2795 domain-containing protein n=1 Tax=Natrinema ejinorense TaxID=373386 RepID=A0A2A5QXQ7_9EURY|nr:hypothetical protein [Natrinema ejinorense]PCR91605.1 hypothetical protein CP557_14360 [Natrinema ejinorense]